ncbi:translocation/assembly module TamB domain-containing protein [Curvibacter sp. HBC61]|uniref:Translocation/assembly module TamB domain-containing protein n=1 Tax=Curvibacter cyanobacteriorum TaxID=3026422 RepID=A0ABT5N0Z0_9BURK|nr:translocation/assembly module TamB domain-containing protein [Curvibacter sp. HBC61]MDD0839713.1 translocation/assembly module TamB domain-containing protein [Curvibacter sp. HBC61]
MSTPPSPSPATPPAPRGTRPSRRGLWLGAALLGLPLALLGSLGLWAHSEGSLATVAHYAPRWLPPGQTLSLQGVRGSLLHGGEVDELHWTQAGTAVQLSGLKVAWDWRPLLERHLALSQLEAARLEVRNEGEAAPPSPPLTKWRLPLTIDTPLSLGELKLPGAAGLQVGGFNGHYLYDGQRHQLQWGELNLAAGHYSGEITVQAEAPMALNARLSGEVPTRLPAPAPATVQARALVQGTLSGPEATLQVVAELQPARDHDEAHHHHDGDHQAGPRGAKPPQAPPATPAPAPQATSPKAPATQAPTRPTPAPPEMSAQLSAQIRPWATQPVHQAQVQLRGIDASLLWPQAPVTALSGTVEVKPPADAAGAHAPARWGAQLRLSNAAPGPWDQQRLPITELSGTVRQAAAAQGPGSDWLAEDVQVQVGAGLLRLNARWPEAAAGHSPAWQLQAQWQGMDPARWLSSLPGAALQGQLTGEGLSGPGRTLGDLSFETELRAQPAPARAGGASPAQAKAALWSALQLRQARASGRWQGGTLQLDTLNLALAEAQLSGQLRAQTRPLGGSAELQWQAPGVQGQIKGQLGAEQGQGQALLQLQDAAALNRWLQRLPGLDGLRDSLPVAGQGQLKADWQGGWASLLAAWQGERPPAPAQALNLNLQLDLPRLEWAANGPAAGLRLQQWQARLAGPLPGVPGSLPLQLSLQGTVHQGGQSLRAQLQAQAGQAAQAGPQASRWAAVLQTLRLESTAQWPGGPWTLTLPEPAHLQLLRQPQQQLTEVSVAPGRALLQGQVSSGSAELAWQTSRWSQQRQQTRWETQGQLRQVPQAWLDAWVALRGDGSGLGVAGDLVLNADWQARQDQGLQAKVRVARHSGDLLLQAEDLPAGTQATAAQRSAGVRQAELTLQLDGEQLAAQLRWDSERAGQLQARLNTRLRQDASGWQLPPDAPLSGELKAQLPQIGVWSMLAPPGWRLRGRLDAEASLQGSLQTPRWTGDIRASNLALRSVVEGVELRDGRLHARLTGNQIDIQEFTLRGAPGGGGGDGGTLSATGQARWTGEALELDLQTRTERLRVSARADRRLAVTGQLGMRLREGQLSVRGALKADQALFILPDETAPTLGADVKVSSAARRRSPAATPPPSPAAKPASGPAKAGPDVQVSFDLGDDFRIQGRGLTTRLRGTLTLRLPPSGGDPQVTGELRTDQGRYKAYGQELTIETGVLRFSGRYDDPALDVLAIRPNISMRVGVKITGSALSPRIRLFSEPEMADADKLAWLVLGRAAASGAAESALLQQAALALLGGGRGLSDGLAQSLGLDEVSFSGVRNTDTGVTSAALTLGKRLSKDFYVSYERSLAGTMGTFYIFYDLTRRLTLRAQTGEKSAVDLIFTVSYD